MVYLLLASLIWSVSFGLVAEQLKVMESMQLATTRLWLSCLVFAFPLIFRYTPSIKKSIKVKLLVMGIGQYGLMYILYTNSYSYLRAWQVALWTITTPLWIIICSANRTRIIAALPAVCLAILGGYLLTPQAPHTSENSYLGIALVQSANFCFAAGQIYYRRIAPQGINPGYLYFWPYLGGALAATLVTSLTTPNWTSFNAETADILRLTYLGVVASGLGFVLWNHGATKVTVAQLAVWNNLKIPIAIIVSLGFFEKLPDTPLESCIGVCLLMMALLVADETFKKAFGNLLKVARP